MGLNVQSNALPLSSAPQSGPQCVLWSISHSARGPQQGRWLGEIVPGVLERVMQWLDNELAARELLPRKVPADRHHWLITVCSSVVPRGPQKPFQRSISRRPRQEEWAREETPVLILL